MVQLSICTAVVLLSLMRISIAEGRVGPGLPSFYRGLLFNRNLNETATQSRFGTQEYFEQLLDHFKPADTRTWKQRYFTDGSYYKKGGPIFLEISGEEPSRGLTRELGRTAKEFRAMCFNLEHRFYGNSHPMKNVDTESLAFLSSQQALADLAYFIQAMNKKYELPSGTKWVVFGGSYAGSLAAWMRLQYPHLVHSAVSSSAPLLAQLNFNEYFEVVRDVIKKKNSACLGAISDGMKQVGSLLQETSGQSKIRETLRSCEPINAHNENEVTYLFDRLASNFAWLVQYSTSSRKNLAEFCDIMVDKSMGTPFERLAEVNSMVIGIFGSDDGRNERCVDLSFENSMKNLEQSSLTSDSVQRGTRQWTWQTCTEFGFYQTLTEIPELNGGHGVNLDFFVKQCQRLFGKRFDEKFLQKAVERTNRLYGDVQLEATRVIHVHGSHDPWHPLGMLQTMHADAPAVFIEGTSHCANLRGESPEDPEQLIKAREIIRDYLRQWLSLSGEYDTPDEFQKPKPYPDSKPMGGWAVSLSSSPVLCLSVTVTVFLRAVLLLD